MKFVLIVCLIFLQIESWAMISLSADKPSPKPGEDVNISATVQDQCTITWMNNASGTVLAVCQAADCTSHVTRRYRFTYQGVNIANFDWSEDGFVWKAQCGNDRDYFVFSKPNGAPSMISGIWILFWVITIIAIWMIGS